jgi:DNA (cytosine-5)-methyltransferase 1
MKDALPKSAYSRLDNKTKRKIVQILDRKSTALSSGGPFVEGPTDPKDAPPVLRKFIRDIRLGGAIQHESRSHMASDLGRYLYSAALASTTGLSPRIEEWPQELLPAHRNVRVTRKRSKTVVDGFRDRFRVQVWDKPASTIMSHNSKDGHYIIHPDPAQCRSLTVRETARLQTFPDNYYFSGSRTEQYLQVGNAVPPFLALQLARVVAKLLEVNGAALTSERMKTFNRSGRAPLAIKYAASMR